MANPERIASEHQTEGSEAATASGAVLFFCKASSTARSVSFISSYPPSAPWKNLTFLLFIFLSIVKLNPSPRA